MSDFKTRLLTEKSELDEKIHKLSPFIGSETFKKIDENQQFLLEIQLRQMQAYSKTLEMRIKLLND